MQVYKYVIRHDPDNSVALCNMGIILERVYGDAVAAVEKYEAALKIDANDVLCLVNYARACYRVSGSMKHSRLLFRCTQTPPFHSPMLNHLMSVGH